MKLLFLISALVFILISVPAHSQWNYSIDDTKVDRADRVSLGTKIKLKIRKLFSKENKQKKYDRKKAKQEEKAEKKRQKMILKYAEKQGSDKEITSGKKVSRRMRKMQKESNRINKDKTRGNFFQRLFLKNKHKQVKFNRN